MIESDVKRLVGDAVIHSIRFGIPINLDPTKSSERECAHRKICECINRASWDTLSTLIRNVRECKDAARKDDAFLLNRIFGFVLNVLGEGEFKEIFEEVLHSGFGSKRDDSKVNAMVDHFAQRFASTVVAKFGSKK